MKIKDILYWGILVNEGQAINAVLNTGNQLISSPQKSMHLTLEFFGGKTEKNIPIERIGEEVEILATAYGTYIKNGIIANQGLLVPVSSLDKIGLKSKNDIPHITIAISDMLDGKGKKIGKAFETAKCDFNIPINAKIKGKIAVFDGSNNYSLTVE